MKCFSVVSRLRPRVAMLRQRHVALVLAVGLALCTLSCDESRGPTSPSSHEPSGGSPPQADTGLIDGIVRDDSGSVSGALIEVTGTPGGSATTGANGVFSFRLPAGLTRLRATKSGYYPRETDVIVQAGATAPVGIVLEKISVSQPLPQAPYTVRGLVRNAHGVPVPGAEVWIYGNNSPIDNRYGVAFTDDAGRYTVTSTQRMPQAVRAMKDGQVTSRVTSISSLHRTPPRRGRSMSCSCTSIDTHSRQSHPSQSANL